MNATLQITGPLIHTENETQTDSSIFINAEKIVAIENNKTSKTKAQQSLELPQNWHLLPGMIDIHMHGAAGSDIMDATEHALKNLSNAVVKEGVTAFLPTSMTANLEQIDKVLACTFAYRQKQNQQTKYSAEILGINLEGPFISAKKCGAQKKEFCLAPSIDLFKHWQKLAPHLIKIVSIAPEGKNASELIKFLYTQDIITAFGHSDADYAQGRAAIAAHCKHVTHLFNAMRSIHHREPNAITAMLLDDKVSVELIADGVHLHPAILKLALKIKGIENTILITDAMRAKNLGDGEFELGGQKVLVKNAVAKLADGTLAGSVLSMDQALRNIINFTGCSLSDAIKMTSTNPAKKLKIFDRKGSIAPNKDADLVGLNEKLEVMLTICRGQVVFNRTKS